VTARRKSGSKIGRAMLALCGAYQLALGTYFMLLRPSFLPEDLRFIGSSAAVLKATAPGLETWLQWVFAVLGGQMAGVGLLVLLAATGDRRGIVSSMTGMTLLILVAATTTVLMSAANFAIGSDFRFALVAPIALWIIALLFYWKSATP